MPVTSVSPQTWWTIFRISLEERLVYRADFALGTLMRFIPIVTQVLLWQAIFEALKGDDVAGYQYNDIVAYYLLVLVGRAFSSMPNLSEGIAQQIRDGQIKKFLIQPIDLIGFLLITRVAHKIVYYGIAIGPFALVFFLCRGFFSGWPDAITLAGYATSLVLAFLLGFFLEAFIGLIGFWFLEVSSLLFVYMLIKYFLSGHMFPLGMLPEPWASIAQAIPLQYLAYFPTQVFLGKIQGEMLAWGLTIQLAWVICFAILCRIAMHYGVRRYSAFGG